jgi:serine/threonine protein kinase
MKFIKSSEIFLLNDTPTFSHTRILYSCGEDIFSANIRLRQVAEFELLDPQQFENVQQIPSDAYQPIAPVGLVVAKSIEDTYVKTPNLSAFEGGENLALSVLEEVKTCELIHDNPHTNLAAYYGCILRGDRIVGLCFRKYPQTLMDMVNPGSLNKTMFMNAEELKPMRARAARYIPLLEDGIRHIHSLKRIHNNFNPSNILITDDDIPVISDFDSSTDPGSDLTRVKRTHGWFNPDVSRAMESNDLDALEELRIWLTGSSADEYQFKEW